jgi:hypothetical protein
MSITTINNQCSQVYIIFIIIMFMKLIRLNKLSLNIIIFNIMRIDI